MQQALPPLADAYALANSGDVVRSVEIIERHAEFGNGEALFALGDMHWRGFHFPPDLIRGRELFGKAADAGFPVAEKAFTNLLGSGIAGRRNWPDALRRLEREAKTDGLRARMLDILSAMRIDANGDPVEIPSGETLSGQPEVTLYRSAFSAAECDFLRLLAEPTYQRSVVIMEDREIADPFRTSDGSTIHWLIEDPATHALNRRIAALTGTTVDQGEALQILRYRPSQQYHPHFDWLPPPNRRVRTALIYLNEDYWGGETAFIKAGLKIRCRKGDCISFLSALPEGELDPLSEHAGLPVTQGIKYLASRWIRERRFTP